MLFNFLIFTNSSVQALVFQYDFKSFCLQAPFLLQSHTNPFFPAAANKANAEYLFLTFYSSFTPPISAIFEG